ncbi:hypothetical protein [Bradyrhizobium sp. Tv2a-2]|uniref:hypothetical protein n=1 Tax=Bradyrhizobium sp. Tv2a-2 TaxID=113395 RepID=UPI00040E1C2E|nr:hypothetical protein [Bradyrhizobium sp. Tv2a-2]
MDTQSLDKLTDGPKMLNWIAGELNILARAFDITGNERVAEQLFNYANQLDAARKMVEEGRNEALNSAVRASEQACGDVFRAAMAGIALGSGKPPAIKL